VLVEWYSNRIGEPATSDEAYGYWLFVVGVLAGLLGILLFLSSSSSADPSRGVGIALGALGLLFIVAGPIVRLHLEKRATYLTYLGVLIGLVAIAWFFVAYPQDWVRGAGQADAIITVYAVGLAVVALGGIGVPLVTAGRSVEELEADLETERAAREQAETERVEAVGDAAAEAEQRAALEVDLERVRASQSQFERYEDAAGEYRWRLRHRNGNVIADSGEGYASRQKAKQGLTAVRRDALGAALVDIEPAPVDVDGPDEATEGEDAPVVLHEAESQATFEVYEDAAGKHRWRLRHDNGNIIADSGQGYASSEGVATAVERVREYVKPADYLRIDPVAFELYRDAGGKWRWRLVHENGNILADGGQGYASRQKALQGVDSVRSNAPEGSNAEFEVYEDAGGKWRWRLRHRNGNIIADGGQGYSSESAAEEAVARVRQYAPDASHLDIGSAAFEVYEDAGEKWRWRLRHRNGNIIADSGQGYASRPGAAEGVYGVKRHAPNAEVETQ